MTAAAFTAPRLPEAPPGLCGWVALPPRRAAPRAPLEGAVTADVTVIGAGFPGLSAARRLHALDPSLRIVVPEAGVVGEGPAGRNSGFIIDLPHEVSWEDYCGDELRKSRDHITPQRRAVDFAKELAAEQGLRREILDPRGRYNLALTPEGDHHLDAYAAQLDRLGEAHERLDARAVTGVTGSTAFTSGIYMPGTVIIQPAAYVRALADSLRDPVRLHGRTLAYREWKAGIE